VNDEIWTCENTADGNLDVVVDATNGTDANDPIEMDADDDDTPIPPTPTGTRCVF